MFRMRFVTTLTILLVALADFASCGAFCEDLTVTQDAQVASSSIIHSASDDCGDSHQEESKTVCTDACMGCAYSLTPSSDSVVASVTIVRAEDALESFPLSRSISVLDRPPRAA
jgi:hypothetical protein